MDWLLKYEIFLDIPLGVISIGSIGLFGLLIVEIVQKRILPNVFLITAFFTLVGIYFGIYAQRNGLFWREKIDAAFIDDFSRMDLTLFNNGNYIIFFNWMTGEERFEGKYKLVGDTIIFQSSQVTKNDFVNMKSVIDYKENKIYFRKEKDGTYNTYYYFQIDF